jgi:hypothetical protein
MARYRAGSSSAGEFGSMGAHDGLRWSRVE